MNTFTFTLELINHILSSFTNSTTDWTSLDDMLQQHHDHDRSCYSAMSLLNTGFGILLLLLMYWRIKPMSISRSVPRPPCIPGLGPLKFALDHWTIWPTIQLQQSNQHRRTWGGPMLNINGFGGAVFNIIDPRCVEHILKTNFDGYTKGSTWKLLLGPLLGNNGVFVSDGSMWKMHRKLAVKFFSKNMLRESSRITERNLLKMIEVMDQKLSNSSQSQSQNEDAQLDIQDMFFRLTVDITSEMLLGVSLDSVQRDGTQHEFALAFDRAQQACFENVVIPCSDLIYNLRLTSAA